MKKINLKVLLRFLNQYSHWNLVRRSDCYHLYFVTKDSPSIATFSASRCKKRKQNGRRKGSKLNREEKEIAPFRRKQEKENGNTQKDVFVFSPIFQNQEQAVHIGLDNAIEDKSKRSSFTSLIWDDFLPDYKKESDAEEEEDKNSISSVDTLTDFESRGSTPFSIGNMLI